MKINRIKQTLTPRCGLHLCYTSVTERESMGWEEEVLESANLRIV